MARATSDGAATNPKLHAGAVGTPIQIRAQARVVRLVASQMPDDATPSPQTAFLELLHGRGVYHFDAVGWLILVLYPSLYTTLIGNTGACKKTSVPEDT